MSYTVLTPGTPPPIREGDGDAAMRRFARAILTEGNAPTEGDAARVEGEAAEQEESHSGDSPERIRPFQLAARFGQTVPASGTGEQREAEALSDETAALPADKAATASSDAPLFAHPLLESLHREFQARAEQRAAEEVRINERLLELRRNTRREIERAVYEDPLSQEARRGLLDEGTATGRQNIWQPPVSRPIAEARKKAHEGLWAPSFPVVHAPLHCHSFRENVQYARQELLLPQEMQLRQRPEHRTWLLSQLRKLDSDAALRTFAFTLRTEDLALLFATLASLKTGKEIERIQTIILLRASRYLYIQAWITLQYAYPRSTVQKALGLLCEVLEEQHYHLSTVGSVWGTDDLLHLSNERINWQEVHLISEISLPNARHFMENILSYIHDSGISGEDFCRRYGIDRRLPLAEALKMQWARQQAERSAGDTRPRPLFTR